MQTYKQFKIYLNIQTHCFIFFHEPYQATIEFVLDFIHFSHNSHGAECGLLSSNEKNMSRADAGCLWQSSYICNHAMYPLPPKNEHVATEKGSSPKEKIIFQSRIFRGYVTVVFGEFLSAWYLSLLNIFFTRIYIYMYIHTSVPKQNQYHALVWLHIFTSHHNHK